MAGGFAGAWAVLCCAQLWRISLLIWSWGFLPGLTAAQDQVLGARQRPGGCRRMRPEARKTTLAPMPFPRKKTSRHRLRRLKSPKKIEGMPDYSIHVDVPVVEVPVMVTTKDGQFISGFETRQLPHFRRWRAAEDHQLRHHGSAHHRRLASRVRRWRLFVHGRHLHASYTFVSMLKKNDWLAVISYDMRRLHSGGLYARQAARRRARSISCEFPVSPRPICSTLFTTPWTGWTGSKGTSTSFW